MKIYFFILLFCLSSYSVFAQNDSSDYSATMEELDAKYKNDWDTATLSKANSTVNATYLTDDEKKVYFYLNLARLHPQLFASTYVADYQVVNAESYNSNFESKKESLINDLKKLSQLPLFLPDITIYNLAKCHATGIGEKGLVTHIRAKTDCRGGYRAECIDFGEHSPLDIVMALLVDASNAGLEHRRICLGNYTKMGISIQEHTQYGKCAVLDFL